MFDLLRQLLVAILSILLAIPAYSKASARLTNETIASDPRAMNGAVSYTYDRVGNRTQKVSTLPGYPNVLRIPSCQIGVARSQTMPKTNQILEKAKETRRKELGVRAFPFSMKMFSGPKLDIVAH